MKHERETSVRTDDLWMESHPHWRKVRRLVGGIFMMISEGPEVDSP